MSPTPAIEMKPIGINVHFTTPIPLKNIETNGLMTNEFTISPRMVEHIIAGIKDSAVCKMSCLVVNPSDFIIP